MQVDEPATKPAKAPKRKATSGGASDSEIDDGNELDLMEVDFEFFDPQPTDYHSIKLLLSQLLSHDASALDLGAVSDLILEQKLVGSTIKTDGASSDPYALLTVLNLNVHRANPAISTLVSYLLPKLSKANPTLHTELTALLSPDSTNHVGLVLSERLVNMPPQVVPPMYRMLKEELEWAVADKEPYTFSHLLFLSRVFLSTSTDLDDDPNASLNPETISATGGGGKDKASKAAKKKAKKALADSVKAKEGKKDEEEQVWLYHAEDEFIARSASHTTVFPYTSAPQKQGGDESFGVQTRGQVMLVPWSKFDTIVEGLEGFLGGLGLPGQ